MLWRFPIFYDTKLILYWQTNTFSGASLRQPLHPEGFKLASLVTCLARSVAASALLFSILPVENTSPRGPNSAAAGSSL